MSPFLKAFAEHCVQQILSHQPTGVHRENGRLVATLCDGYADIVKPYRYETQSQGKGGPGFQLSRLVMPWLDGTQSEVAGDFDPVVRTFAWGADDSLRGQWHELDRLEERIATIERRICELSRADEAVKALGAIPGVGCSRRRPGWRRWLIHARSARAAKLSPGLAWSRDRPAQGVKSPCRGSANRMTGICANC